MGAHLHSSRRLLVEDAARKLHLLLSSPLAAHKDAIVQVHPLPIISSYFGFTLGHTLELQHGFLCTVLSNEIFSKGGGGQSDVLTRGLIS